jgi:hypothetical protein
MILMTLAGVAAAFDPEAATNAYLATLKGAARAKSNAYFEGGYWLIIWGALVAIASELIQLHFGLARRWRDWAERIAPRWLAPALFTFPYVIAGTLITLPWSIYTGFVREKQYDLMNQSFGDWAIDQGKGLAIGVIAGAIVFTVVLAALGRADGDGVQRISCDDCARFHHPAVQYIHRNEAGAGARQDRRDGQGKQCARRAHLCVRRVETIQAYFGQCLGSWPDDPHFAQRQSAEPHDPC